MKSCNVLLVSPGFPTNTFWNLAATCAVVGARHPQIPLGLITVAALLPAEWTCRLVDRNVARLTNADLDWADLVMTGGMNVQRADCLRVIELAQARGKPVVVGGPDVTSEPDTYMHADFQVCGEAEGVIDSFVAAWCDGQRHAKFITPRSSVDISRTPVPRFDLVQRRDYLHYSVQFSRGCPFTCEFCDIIELYGRVPRVKTVAQFLGELERLYDAGYRGHVDFVDDNFIGNKKAVKALLPALTQWQRDRHYPFWFTTEASLNLADDEELLQSMREANFGAVFVGIESPDAATLIATSKKQNTRRRIADSVHRIHAAGLFVLAGFIVGFDSERSEIASGMIACIEDSDIPVCTAGLLTALPNTQLYRRLEREGRLFPWSFVVDRSREIGGDQCTLGLNFETQRPRRLVLADYKQVIDAIYRPQSYFDRVRHLAAKLPHWPPHGAASETLARWHLLGLDDRAWHLLVRLLWGSVHAGPATFLEVTRILIWAVRLRPELLHVVGMLAAMYLHLGPFARTVSATTARQIADIDNGMWRSPTLPIAPRRTSDVAA